MLLYVAIFDLVVGKEMDDDADDEVRVTYAGVDSVLGIPVQKDQAQVFNVLLQQATYELKKGQPMVSTFQIISMITSKYYYQLYYILNYDSSIQRYFFQRALTYIVQAKDMKPDNYQLLGLESRCLVDANQFKYVCNSFRTQTILLLNAIY